MKKVVYIMGAGRSGTTLLDIILGNAKDTESCGELNRFPKREGVPPGREGDHIAAFWAPIREQLVAKYDLKKMNKLHERFEYHTGFLKFLAGIYNKTELHEYRTFLQDFYQLIFEKSGRPCIVDSSKYPGRAVQLGLSLPYEITYVYLKRDPVDVVRSFAKKEIEQPSKGWLASNVYYFAVNALCALAFARLGRKHKVIAVKYEDLLRSPDTTLSGIGQQLGMDLNDVITRIGQNKEFSVGRLFDGNRIRMKSALKLAPEKERSAFGWKDYLTRWGNFVLYR